MKTITFNLTALQPLLLTSLQGDPNSSVSFPYIPGSVIRGALIGKYCQQQGDDLDIDDPAVRRWFFDGTTRYLHAYPLIGGARSIPMPRSLAAEKTSEWRNDQLEVYDRSVATPEDITLRAESGFVAPDVGGGMQYTNTRMLINIHNQRNRLRGRGAEDEGAVFRYEAIAPEQTFVAAIVCDDQDVDTIKSWLPEQLWIGGSRSAGYGQVHIDSTQIVDNWNEITLSASEDDSVTTNNSTRFTITLTSDMIIRAANGGYTTAFPQLQVEALLGVPLTLNLAYTVLATTLHGGFNRTWGLPIPQIPALAAGSMLTYTCQTLPSEAATRMLETDGFGERRAEGFGRVVCNLLPAKETHTLYRWSSNEHTSATESVLDAESQELAQVMARRILEQRLESRLIEQTGSHQVKGTISNTQLSRLRIIARKALSNNNLNSIKQFLNTLPANARDQFARARVGPKSLTEWIEQHLTPIATEWDSESLKVNVAGITLEPDQEMKNGFTLRLLMAMARLKVKGNNDE